MTPDMHNDPAVIFALAVLAWAAYAALAARAARRRKRDDAPRENTWRNRWH